MVRIIRKKARGITTMVHPDFHRKIEEERIRFMKKHRLDKLTTVAFTGILSDRKRFGLK